MLLYGDSIYKVKDTATIDTLPPILSITPYADTQHEEYISKIKEIGECIMRNDKIEYYRCDYYKGQMVVRLYKDDNRYFDLAEYQEYKSEMIYPTLFTLSAPKEVYTMISTPMPQYIVYSHRYYGQPKLTKPKELKGIKHIGTATFIDNHCNPQVFIRENDIYIKHTDYFSASWKPPKEERMGMPLNYYLEKYFGDVKSEKFIYSDC